MPPLRFLHAAGLDPEAALPMLPASPADVFSTAPMQVLQRVVTHAIDLHVDFLLVSVAADDAFGHSGFRSAAAMQQEFARLQPHQIPAYLAVGSNDDSWQSVVARETALTVVAAGESASLAGSKGRPQVTLHCLGDANGLSELNGSRPWHAADRRDAEIHLAVAPTRSVADLEGAAVGEFRYVGCGCGPRRSMPLESGIVHSPGDVQSSSIGDCGPHGATLVSIDAQGNVQTEFVPLAAVRYESLTVRVRPGELIEDLADRMSERFADQKYEGGEQAWNVRWTVEADGALFAQLADPVQRSMLVGLLPESAGDAVVTHRIGVVPHPSWPAFDQPFAADFAAALVEQEGELSDATRRRSVFGTMADAANRRRIDRLLDEADVPSVVHQARRFGMRVVAAAELAPDR